MTDDLDRMLERLRAQPVPDRLNRLEADVMFGIAGARSMPTASPAWRTAAVGLALAAGLGVGGTAAAIGSRSPQPGQGLVDGRHLAPSSLLGRGE